MHRAFLFSMIICAMLAFAGKASAATFTVEGDQILLRGKIVEGDAKRFKKFYWTEARKSNPLPTLIAEVACPAAELFG